MRSPKKNKEQKEKTNRIKNKNKSQNSNTEKRGETTLRVLSFKHKMGFEKPALMELRILAILILMGLRFLVNETSGLL
jgi:hypothetical protein